MTSPKEIMKKKGLRPLRRYGQSFLQDKNMIARIVDAADIHKGDTVLEIGPGLGIMTALIAGRAKEVIAIEIDPYMVNILTETISDQANVKIIQADILTYDLAAALPESSPAKLNVIGNVPYNISTPILFHLMAFRNKIKSITIMLQKEVADRLAASPGTKTYGIPSVVVSMYAQVVPVMNVPPECFYPKPKVTSSVIRIDIRESPLIELRSEDFFSATVKRAFSQRRKTLFNNLKGIKLQDRDADISSALDKAGIDGGRRAETLSVTEFGRLSNALLVS
jgi:16S rRNA (adenine1518-N6/adenine1519-N6)-dimethyltransferase